MLPSNYCAFLWGRTVASVVCFLLLVLTGRPCSAEDAEPATFSIRSIARMNANQTQNASDLFRCDSLTIASLGQDGAVSVWDVQTGCSLYQHHTIFQRDRTESVNPVVLSNQGEALFWLGSDGVHPLSAGQGLPRYDPSDDLGTHYAAACLSDRFLHIGTSNEIFTRNLNGDLLRTTRVPTNLPSTELKRSFPKLPAIQCSESAGVALVRTCDRRYYLWSYRTDTIEEISDLAGEHCHIAADDFRGLFYVLRNTGQCQVFAAALPPTLLRTRTGYPRSEDVIGIHGELVFANAPESRLEIASLLRTDTYSLHSPFPRVKKVVVVRNGLCVLDPDGGLWLCALDESTPHEALTAQQVWEDLGAEDSRTLLRAMLAAPLLDAELYGLATSNLDQGTPADVAQEVSDLGSEDPAIRNRARQRLIASGLLVESALRSRLAGEDPEVVAAIEDLLNHPLNGLYSGAQSRRFLHVVDIALRERNSLSIAFLGDMRNQVRSARLASWASALLAGPPEPSTSPGDSRHGRR